MSAESPKTILLVEDEAIIAMTEKMTLENCGYKVIIAHTGEEAVARIEKAPDIDLILMDIDLGAGLDGTEAAAAILERRDLPVVFLSSHMEPKIVEKTEKITSYGYVVKNSSITVLDASIKMAFKLFEAKIKEKEKEAALLESEEKFRLISGLSPVGIYLTNPEGECIYINDSWSKMAGMTLEEAMGQGWINGIHPEDRKAVFANWEKMVASKGEWGKEYRFQDKTGKTTWVYGVAAPQRDSAGNIIRYIGVNVAISERKQAEEELQKRNQFIESILDKMPIGFAVNSIADGVARYMNGNFTKIYGWPKETFSDIDRFFASVYPGPEGQELKARVIGDMNSGDPERMAWDDLKITTRTGEHRYISARNIPIREQNLMVSTVWDTTQAHEAQQALREAETRYRLLFESSPDGIVIIDPATARILEFNQKAHEQLGYSREEFAGLSIPDIEAVETEEETRARISRVMREGPETFETRQRTRQGETRDIQVTAQFTKFQDRPIYHCLWRDITELKRSESGREAALATLKASEARAQALLRTIPDLLFRIDRQGVFLDYKADSKDLYVQSEPTLIGKRLRDLVPASFADLIDQKTRAALETGALQTFEYRLPVPGRGERDYEARLAASGADEVTAIVRDITERKQAESQMKAAVAAQQESEKRLRDIIFSMADWVWEVDENGVYTFSSDKGSDLLGASRGDIIGKTPFDFMPPEEAERVGAIFSRIVADKLPIRDLENWNIGKNGERICLLTNGVPILDAQGNLKGYRGVDKDITERKREEKLPETLYKISQAMYTTDNLDELFEHVHRALAGIIPSDNLFIALLSDDGRALTFPYFIDEKDPGDNASISTSDRQSLTVEVLATKKSLLLDETELLDRYASGRNRVWGTAPRCWLGVPLMIRDTIIGVMAVQDYHNACAYGIKDVALLESTAGQIAVAIDRKRAEAALRENNSRLELAMQAANMAWWEMDMASGNVTFENRKAEMLGFPPEKFKRYPDFMALVHPEDHERAMSAMRTHLEGAAEKYEVEYRIATQAGEYQWFHDIGSVVKRDAAGKPLNVTGLVINITERKRAELLEQAVYEIARAADQAASLDDLYRSVHRIIQTLMPATNFLIARYDEKEDMVSFPYFVDEKDPAPKPRKSSRGLTDYVLRTRRTLLSGPALEKELERTGEAKRRGSPSACWLGVPLKVGDKAIGVIALDNYTDPRAYGEREKKILEYVSGQIANAIARKTAEEEIKRQLAEKEILLKEVHHRIKNNIAAIAGLISLRLQSIANPEAAAVLKDAFGRIDSMRILYDKLLLSEKYQDVPVKNYVESLADTVMALFPGSARVALDMHISDFHLDSKRLFSLGIIINELLTNKMKYAFSGRERGSIRIDLVRAGDHVALAIEDDGNVLPDGFDLHESKGFGLMLVKMLSQQLKGSFSIAKHAGTRCSVAFDL